MKSCSDTNGVVFRCFLLLALLGLVGQLAGCGSTDQEEAIQEVSRNVRVLVLEAESLVEYFEVSGPVSPVRGTDLSAEEAGRVVSLLRVKGAAVSDGDAILELDQTLLKADMEAAVAALAAEEFNIDKMRQLFAAEKISKSELLAAESRHAQALARVNVSRERFERATIRSPFAGIVSDRYVEIGQLVLPGLPVVRVIDPYVLKLQAYLTEDQVRWVKSGDKAILKLGEQEAKADGLVTWVGMEADRLTGKYKVEIEIPNPQLSYRSGVIGRALLPKRKVQGVVAAPRDAIVPGRVGPTGYVVVGGRAELRRLTLGGTQGLMVQVTAGLVVGDSLVVRGQRDLREGNLVTVVEVAESADGSVAGDPQAIKAWTPETTPEPPQ